MKSKNIDTIIDDSDESLPSKMKKFNLIGIPFQIIVGKKFDENFIEFREIGMDIKKININNLINLIKKHI